MQRKVCVQEMSPGGVRNLPNDDFDSRGVECDEGSEIQKE